MLVAHPSPKIIEWSWMHLPCTCSWLRSLQMGAENSVPNGSLWTPARCSVSRLIPFFLLFSNHIQSCSAAHQCSQLCSSMFNLRSPEPHHQQTPPSPGTISQTQPASPFSCFSFSTNHSFNPGSLRPGGPTSNALVGRGRLEKPLSFVQESCCPTLLCE